jgi:hypothetical protein
MIDMCVWGHVKIHIMLKMHVVRCLIFGALCTADGDDEAAREDG